MRDFDEFWSKLDLHRSKWSVAEAAEKLLASDSDLDVTPQLLEELTSRLGFQIFGEWITPPAVVRFVSRLATLRKPTSVLDPMCGTGLLLSEVAEACGIREIHGIEINKSWAAVASKLLGSRAQIKHGDAFNGSVDENSRYDLIVSEPPFGAALRAPLTIRVGEKPTVLRYMDDAAVYLACQHLSPGGTAILLVRSALIWSDRTEASRQLINRLGCTVRACIQLPGGSLQKTAIESYILVIDRGTQAKVFVGQYSDDGEHQKVLTENLRKGLPGKLPSQGRLVDWSTFKGFRPLEAGEKLRQMGRRLGLQPVQMRTLIIGVKKTSKAKFQLLPEKDNSVYLPCTGRGKAAASQSNLSARLKDYVQLQLDPELADSRFVAELFNKELGQTLFDSIRTGSIIDRIDVDDLLATTFYLPSLGTQEKIIRAVGKLASIRSEVQELETAMWADLSKADQIAKQAETINQEDRFVDWMETLPFPLASILWRHRTANASPKERYEMLLHFFEALAEFVATIHLSAFSSDRELWLEHGPGFEKVLKSQNLSLTRATFGTWKAIAEYFGTRCRRLATEKLEICERVYRTKSDDVLKMLGSAKLLEVLQKANEKRNAWSGHVGAVGDRQAESIRLELKMLVDECRGVFGRTWQEYELIQPREAEFSQGIFHYKGGRIMGTRTPFEGMTRETVEPMDRQCLYLIDRDGDRGLKLLPFVRLMSSPRTAANACYFYSRNDVDGHRLLSYHFDTESEVVERFADIDSALLSLQIPAELALQPSLDATSKGNSRG